MAYRKPISPPESSCADLLECAASDPEMALVLLLAAAGVVLLFATFALAHIDTARSLLEEERTRIGDEAAAFGAFARRVADLEVATTTVTDGGPTATTTFKSQAVDDLAPVREAYRETVMAVPHYEEEYDESLATNMRLEFGEDVASAVENDAALTPQLKATIVERSRTARRQRASLLGKLEGEAEALDDAERTLEHCRCTAQRLADADLSRRSFDELAAEWRLLDDRREAVEALLSERQSTVQERDRKGGTRPGGPSFEEYLYEPMAVTHPVLASATDTLEDLERARERVEQALASAT